jgi:hypothetical protein
MNIVGKFGLLISSLILVSATHALAQEEHLRQEESPRLAQVVALDECDPTTFNATLGPDFCHNVTLGAFTTLNDLFAKAVAGTPDAGWDCEPEISQDQGRNQFKRSGRASHIHEVAHFGGGFIPGLNSPGEDAVPECAGGFSNVAVARTRILQGSTVPIKDLSKGKHLFQCYIHPWMRVKVEVNGSVERGR